MLDDAGAGADELRSEQLGTPRAGAISEGRHLLASYRHRRASARKSSNSSAITPRLAATPPRIAAPGTSTSSLTKSVRPSLSADEPKNAAAQARELDQLCDMARTISQQIRQAANAADTYTPPISFGSPDTEIKRVRLNDVPCSAATERLDCTDVPIPPAGENGSAYVIVELTRALSKAATSRDTNITRLEVENQALRSRVSELEKQLDELAFSFDALMLCLGEQPLKCSLDTCVDATGRRTKAKELSPTPAPQASDQVRPLDEIGRDSRINSIAAARVE